MHRATDSQLGRALCQLVLGRAVIAAPVLGASSYLALAAVHLSAHPLADTIPWLVVLGLAACMALAALGLR